MDLHSEVKSENLRKVDELIKAGADINLKDQIKNNTPLHVAVESGQPIIVHYLIEKGANINCQNGKLNTPLILAIKHEQINIARQLIRAGADVNIKDEDERGPLLNAIKKMYIETTFYSRYNYTFQVYKKLICKLVEAGADVNIPDSTGTTPFLELTEKINDSDLIQLFVKKGAANIRAKDSQGISPLMNVIMKGNVDSFYCLVDANSNTKHVNRYGKSVFEYAVQCENPKILEYFLKSGFNVNERNHDGTTPLMKAAEVNNITNGIMLLNSGAYINAIDDYHVRPLLYAIDYSTSSFVKLLIEAGAKVDTIDFSGIRLSTRAALQSTPDIKMLEDNLKSVLRISRNIDLAQYLELRSSEPYIDSYDGAINLMIKYLLLLDIYPSKYKIKLPNNLSKLWDDCEKQVLKMNQYKMGNVDITLRSYLLERNINQRAYYISNSTTGIRQEETKKWYKENADLYVEIIEECISEDVERAKMIHKWNVITQEQQFKKTTVLVRLHIAEQLANSNLKWFVCKH